MAATVPVIALGGFGARVADLLGDFLPHPSPLPATEYHRAFDGNGGTVVLASWRPAPALAERVDALAYRTGRPWLPVVLENTVIRVGPLVRPPHGPCFGCYRRRRAQHDPRAATSSLLLDQYDRDPASGPGGFLPQHARAAAAVTTGCLRPTARTGVVTTVRFAPWAVDTAHVVPTHGCQRCQAAPRAADADVAGLRTALGRVWHESSGVRR